MQLGLNIAHSPQFTSYLLQYGKYDRPHSRRAFVCKLIRRKEPTLLSTRNERCKDSPAESLVSAEVAAVPHCDDDDLPAVTNSERFAKKSNHAPQGDEGVARWHTEMYE